MEFPAWFVCQGCRRLLHREVLGEAVTADGRRYHAQCDRKVKTVVPVRFVVACSRGHLAELPWALLAHYEADICQRSELYLDEGTFGDFNDIRVSCRACSAKPRRLALLQSKNVTFRCDGRRPWLPREQELETPPCTEDVRLLVRTASNGYFSLRLSALSVPDPDNEIRDALSRDAERIRTRLAKGEDRVKDFLEDDHAALVAKHGIDAALGQAILLANGVPAPRAPIRVAEYHQLTTFAPSDRTGESFDEGQTFVARRLRLPEPMPKISCVTLVHRLREVEVQLGFTRLEPVSADAQGQFDDVNIGVKRAPLAAEESWLPAATLQGEGIFFALDAAALEAWEKRPAVVERVRALAVGWNRWRTERHRGPGPAHPAVPRRSLLLPSLALAPAHQRDQPSSAATRRAPSASASTAGPTGDAQPDDGRHSSLYGHRRKRGHARRSRRSRAAGSADHLRRALELGEPLLQRPGLRRHAPEHDPSDRSSRRCVSRLPPHRGRAASSASTATSTARSSSPLSANRRSWRSSRARTSGDSVLTDVPTSELRRLLTALDDGSATTPVSDLRAAQLGLDALANHLAALAAFDTATLRALLRAVLAEREAATPRAELVWTGPEGPTGRGRRTAIVFRRLLESAERDVWIAGYSIDHGKDLFAPLHDVMKERNVEARFILHPKYEPGEERLPTIEAGADFILNRFLTRNWPFGDPTPDLYYDPRPLERRPRASMHIKAVVVDEARVLIGSANFTDAGQHRNYEAGVYLEDPDLARRLVTQLQSLIDAKLVRRHGEPPAR